VSYREKGYSEKVAGSFTVSYSNQEYHYTIYYYDQAGNLVKTIPPKGVRPDFSTGFIQSVITAKPLGNDVRPLHVFATHYRYNSLNQVVKQTTPDGGTSHFWYDYLGRLVVSQNEEQALGNKWSYTLYDPLGRIKEVGQKYQTQAMLQTTSQSITAMEAWLNGTNTGAKDQITRTIYDEPYPGTDNIYIKQENLRNRVSYSQVWNNAANQYAASATYYSYDIHGNVEVLLQDFGHQSQQNAMNVTYNRFKTIRYDYDLVSGKVNQVMYQPSYYNASMQQVVRRKYLCLGIHKFKSKPPS